MPLTANLFLLSVIVLVVLAVLFVESALSQTNKNPHSFLDDSPYTRKPPLTKPEQVAYFRITEALKAKQDLILLCQVPLSSFLAVKKGHNRRELNNRINRMSVDFVVVKKDFSIFAVIELDDSTHSRSDRIKADEKKNAVLSSVGLKIIRWNVNSIPSKEDIQRLLTDLELERLDLSNVIPLQPNT